MINDHRHFLFIAAISFFFVGFAETYTHAQKPAWGKSHHGSHYDEGPRSKPWVMEGIGETHFPVTTNHPEVQRWFDQGNTLLHGFWYFEAERAFRWCIKLDPDCAMAYWGLARCASGDSSREKKFFKQAIARKDNITKREQDYLELWQAKYAIKGKEKARNKAVEKYMKLFDNLLINYPDDIEARALYWHEVPRVISKSAVENQQMMRYALESVLQEVLRKNPDHVGALHYRVHNWDGEEGHFALDSCLRLSNVAPKCGHLQHMPGHVLSSIGLWNEAAIAMDSATRVEKEYMRRRMVLPEDNWDYVHNLDYLAYIQEQLGLYDAALISCKQLMKGPEFNNPLPIGNFANFSMVRLLVKFEKWDEILNQEKLLFRWNENGMVDPALRAYARTHALIGTGQLLEAEKELAFMESHINKIKSPLLLLSKASKWFAKTNGASSDDKASMGEFIDAIINVRLFELKGKLAIANGNHEQGIEWLEKAAELQFENWHNDPPMDAVFVYNTLGEAYLEQGENEKAAAAFEKTLEKVINDGFALSGLVIACNNLKQTEKAQNYMGRLAAVWSDAETSNRWLAKAKATKVESASIPSDLMKERNYQLTVLDKLGNSIWTAPDAPELSATASDGTQVSLKEYRGKNVIVVFYLGGQCLHCMEQMNEAYKLADQFKQLDTEIIAISKDDLDTIRQYEQSEIGVKLLSDPDFSNARRFNSYDDFEEIELHSTILIDYAGRVHWSKHGGDPFMDFDFLMNEVNVLNTLKLQNKVTTTGDTIRDLKTASTLKKN